MAQGRQTRRRGDLLLESIYEAATEIIRTEGYARLTFLEIARLAKTSRTVLYRRWGTPFNLVREIMVYRSEQALGGNLNDMIEDTGSLRDDFLLLMDLYQKIYGAVGPEIMNAVLFEMSRSSEQIPPIQDNVVFRNIQSIEKILAFAEARGEKLKPISDETRTLPFDLIRMGHLWGKQTFDRKTMERLVDEILLPVFIA